jgi:hypothetical protein
MLKFKQIEATLFNVSPGLFHGSPAMNSGPGDHSLARKSGQARLDAGGITRASHRHLKFLSWFVSSTSTTSAGMSTPQA